MTNSWKYQNAHCGGTLNYIHWLFFTNNGLAKLQWTSGISDSCTKIRVTSRSVPGLTTDSLYAVDKALVSRMVVPFWVYVFKWQLVCKFDVVDRNFLLEILLSFIRSYISQTIFFLKQINNSYSTIVLHYWWWFIPEKNLVRGMLCFIFFASKAHRRSFDLSS